MPTYNDAHSLGQLDYTNPLTAGAEVVFVPSETSGNTTKNIATGDMCTFYDPNVPTNNWVWNTDGSISPAQNSAGANTNATTYNGMNYQFPIADNQTFFNNKTIVLILDVAQTAKQSNKTCHFFKFSGVGDLIRFMCEPYQSQVFTFRVDANYTTNQYQKAPLLSREVLLLAYDVAAGRLQVYADGVKLHDYTGLPSNPFSASSYSMMFGSGNIYSKIYAEMMLRYNTISDAEIQSLASNPYQLFQSATVQTSAPVQTSYQFNTQLYSGIQSAHDIQSQLLGTTQQSVEVQTQALGSILNSIEFQTQHFGSISSQHIINTQLLGVLTSSVQLDTQLLGSLSNSIGVNTQLLGNISTQADIRSQLLGSAKRSTDFQTQLYGAVSSPADIQTQLYGTALSSTEFRVKIAPELVQVLNASIVKLGAYSFKYQLGTTSNNKFGLGQQSSAYSLGVGTTNKTN